MAAAFPSGADRSGGQAFSKRLVGLLIVGAVIECALLALWQRNGFWDFSDGVYADSARQLLHGLTPYNDFAAAQPPPVYLVGALLLAVHDGLATLRAGLGAIEMATAAMVGVCVWRMSHVRWLAVTAAGVAPLLPISLHEHAQLIPETLAGPLLLAGALCCARAPRAVLGGGLLALAAAFKPGIAIPAIAIALAGRAPRRSLSTLLAVGATLSTLWLVLYGGRLWSNVVEAQAQVGLASLHYAAGLLTQSLWNELPLMVPAAAIVLIGFRDGQAGHEPALVRTIAAAAGAGLLLAVAVFKHGTYLNVVVVADPPLLCLAAYGSRSLWQRGHGWRALVASLGVFLAAQSISLLANPGDPWLARRPGARVGLAWTASPATIDRQVRAARRCPSVLAYAGSPYVAFLASRRMPGDQPDLFMIANARGDVRFARRAAADRPTCP